MGSRLLYALIVGVIIGALALRIWDLGLMPRLRSLVFDTYQQIEPRKFDPRLPLRIVDIDEDFLKKIGQWPWPRTVLAELVQKLNENGAAAIGFDMVFPEPDRMSPANALRFWPKSDALAGLRSEVEKLPSNDQTLAEAIAKGQVVLGFIATPLGAVTVAAVVALSWYAFHAFGWLVDPIYPAIALTAIYLAGTLFVFLRTERERNRVRHAFGHYMAPALGERLAGEPSQLRLGGETRDMTLLFSDVRSFTTISEGLDAEELTRFLNSLFTPLSNIILEEQGTIDKFMGDAVMAFWNAPLDDAEHASHACRAALRMMGEMQKLNEHWQQEVAAKGGAFTPVKIGIGLNSGVCCVGNLGTETRFDYSVIGDNVNVASRLEGQSKTYEVVTVVGESTTARAPDFAFLELDLLKVKGKTGATCIFALLGDSALKTSQRFINLSTRHNEFLAKYRGKDWDAAEALSRECDPMNGGLQRLYALYRERIDFFRQNPPPPDWDGTAEALAK